MDPPFTKLDILTCRNLLIYLGSDLQKKLLPLFYYCLKPGGILMQGSAESVGDFNDLFKPFNGKARLFQRSSTPPRIFDLDFPTRYFPTKSDSLMDTKPRDGCCQSAESGRSDAVATIFSGGQAGQRGKVI